MSLENIVGIEASDQVRESGWETTNFWGGVVCGGRDSGPGVELTMRWGLGLEEERRQRLAPEGDGLLLWLEGYK